MRNRSGGMGTALAAVFAVYFLLDALGLWLAVAREHAAAVWPATGVAVAAVLLLGHRAAATVFVSSLAVNFLDFLVFRHHGLAEGIFPAVAIAVANASVAWLGAEGMRRYCGGTAAFRHGGGFFRFVCGALAVPLVGATIGVGAGATGGIFPTAILGEIWLRWWWGDFASIVIFTPLVLIWVRPNFTFLRQRIVEIAGLGSGLVLAGGVLAGDVWFAPGRGFPGAFLVIPIVLWIGFRLRGPGVTVALLALTALTVIGALHGWTAFPGNSANESLVYLQWFLAIIAVVGLGFVAVLEERDDNLAKLHAFNEDLERKVMARTRQLEQINQELTDAVSIVAHDVRGPVSGIRTLARHMRWAGLDLSAAEGNELLGEIERTSAEAVEMMGRLLDLQRANHRAVGLTPANVGRLVADMCRHYEIAAQEKGIALRVIRPGREMAHLVDTDGLKFIISNLVSNALKFLPVGGAVEVRVSEGFSGCTLIVSDNGPGISERELSGLFNRFAKAANRPTAGESSSGLGLFIVRKLVLAMKGTLYVESVPGEGATFVVEWPAEAIQSENARI